MQDPLLTILKTSFNQSDRTGLHAQRIISENNLKSGDQATNSSVVSSWCISHFSIGKDTSQLLANDYFHGKTSKKCCDKRGIPWCTKVLLRQEPWCSQNQFQLEFFHSIGQSQKHISNGLKTCYLKPFVWNQHNKKHWFIDVYCTSYCSWSVIYLCFRQ